MARILRGRSRCARIAQGRHRRASTALDGNAHLALALVGVYGVVSYSVSQRTQEIGIRMALGAGSRDVTGMVVRQSARVVVLGGLIGVALALAMGKGLSVFLFGVSPFDPATFTLVPLALAEYEDHRHGDHRCQIAGGGTWFYRRTRACPGRRGDENGHNA